MKEMHIEKPAESRGLDVPDTSPTTNERYGGREVLQGLTEREWIDLWNGLTLACNRYYGALDGEDLIMEAIEAVFEGRRSWEPTVLPFLNLHSIIRSIASNRLGKETRLTSLDSTVAPPVLHTDSQAETYEQQDRYQTLHLRLQRIVAGDSFLIKLINYMFENPDSKPRTAAEDLQVKPKEIYNARKRLMRKIKAAFGSESEIL